MKVSIVTISFNQAQFLEQAILSVLDQDYPDIEYIIIDPGSTDGSRDIILKYRKKISKIVFEPDEGPADGLNKGFNLATGEILAYLNSDDLLSPYTVSRFVKEFLKSNADVISGHGYIIDENSNVIKKIYSHRFNSVAYVYGACILVQQSTFFRNEIFKRTSGFNKNNRVSWDGELWFDMALAGAKFKRINEFLSYFRIYPGTITGSGKFTEQSIQILKRHAQKIGIQRSDGFLPRRRHWLVNRILDPYLVVSKLSDILLEKKNAITK